MTTTDHATQAAGRRRRRAALAAAALAVLMAALVFVLGSADREAPRLQTSAHAPAPGGAAAARPEPSPRAAGSDRVAVSPREPHAAGSCPGGLPAAGSPCPAPAGEALICGYAKEGGAVTCHCQDAGDVPATWSCVPDSERPRIATCPAQQPSAGGPCEAVGLGCVYNAGVDGTACTCKLGDRVSAWTCVPYLDYI
jgi:hypothetical protein